MTGSLFELLLAAIAFTGGHFLLASTPLRDWLLRRIGKARFVLLFSVLIAVALSWLISSYARAPEVELWPGTAWTRYLALALMPFAAILLFGALRLDNPTSVTGHPGQLDVQRLGIFAITRHPMMWGFSLWAAAHLLANGDAASLIFFASFLLLALPGTVAIDAKIRKERPLEWMRLAACTSNLPFAALASGRCRLAPSALLTPVLGGLALFVVLLVLHRGLFGVSPLGG